MALMHFAQSIPKVLANCILHVGWFTDTVPDFKTTFLGENYIRPLGLLHIDSDLYSSAQFILSELVDSIIPGTIIIFDEYLNHPTWKYDEFKAWQEFVVVNAVKYEYIGYVSKHQQVAIRVLEISRQK